MVPFFATPTGPAVFDQNQSSLSQPAEVDFSKLTVLQATQERTRDYRVKPPEDAPELSAD